MSPIPFSPRRAAPGALASCAALAALGLALALPAALRAQEGPRPPAAPPLAEPARPSVERLRPPALLVRDDDAAKQRPLRVRSARAEVTIAGGIATTTLDLVFVNDLPRVLEGELVLPLPRGASITRFALEVEGGLREAVVVEREKARVAYEEVVRRGIDPGLVEWAAGNAFRTRVYPIPANGTKRLVLGYDEALDEVGQGRAVYRLPLGFGAPLESFVARVTAATPAAPETIEGGLDMDFSARASGAGFGGGFEGKDVSPKDLSFAVSLGGGRPLVSVEPARVRPAIGEVPEHVFVARVPAPDLPAEAAPPGHVTLLWDASGSAAARDAARERAFLEALLRRLGRAKVRLAVFSNEVWPEAGGEFEVADGLCPSLLARVGAIRPDGGTRLACLDLRAMDASTDRFVLVSDGLSTFGEGEAMPGAKPVACVSSAANADWRALERIGRAGAVIDLSKVAPEEAARRALEPPLALVGIEAEAGRIAEVLPAAPARVDGGLITLVGRARAGAAAKLALRFARGGGEARVEVEVPGAAEDLGGAVERLHAQRRVDDLLGRPGPDEAAVVAIARRHGIVTPFTSMLVLDRLEDYVRHRVVPPKELQEKYFEIVEAEKAAAAKTREEKLAQVRERWRARVAWWSRDFVYPEGLTVPEEDEKSRAAADARRGAPLRRVGGNGRLGGEGGGEPPPPDGTATPAAPPASEPVFAETAAAPGARARGEGFLKKSEAGPGSASPIGPAKPAIELAPWDPRTPYLDALKRAEPEGREAIYAAYLAERSSRATNSAFFLDVADFLFARRLDDLGLRVLSNLAELELESPPLLRILGYRLRQQKLLDLAIATFRRVAALRPEEPQSHRDLGLALAEAKRYAEAVGRLERVVLGTWDGRFPDIELVALGELNGVIAKAGGASEKRLHTLPDDLVRLLDVDLRVVLTWDADLCDMDLWVVEPSGEKAYYGKTLTTIGGAFGQDFTRGYGPEEYLLKKAMPGTFKLRINYYGNTQQTLAGDTTIQVLVVKNWGRPNEERIEVTRRLKEKREVLDIAEVAFPR
jgi:tetratricopeptide (TPR) repeat protein